MSRPRETDRRVRLVVTIVIGAAFVSIAVGQWQQGRGRSRRPPDRSEYPQWQIESEFAADVFTFVRIRYNSRGSVWDSRWDNDFPDADWNLSYRLQQLTSLQVDPNGKVLQLTDPELFRYPFIFILGTRDLVFSETEVAILRRYLSNGGFLMVDDFWAHEEWLRIREQMQRVFPDRPPRELSLGHEIFHIVYDLHEKPQVPSIQAWRRGWDFEYWHGETYGDEDPHFWGIHDDQGRVMVLLCHNNDLCDGWEREGEDTEYFHRYSEKWSYPMGINIITYVMTH